MNNELTIREQETLQLTADGLTEGEMGLRLGIAASTAKKHRAAVKRKLGALSSAHAVALAFRKGLLR